ncbi:MAG: rod shape-determining protein MreC [Chlorobi bacterium]|nr:rod shape-determining protein MreC [Chlorobiota bacterium]
MRKYLKKILEERRQYFVLVVLLFISLAFLPLNKGEKLRNIKRYAFGTFAYLTYLENQIAEFFTNTKEIERLQKQNAHLMLENNLLREYALENRELRKMLSFQDSSAYPLLPAKVISKLISSIQGNLIIDRGENDGVKTGMPVITPEGLVGLVVETFSEFSIVRTLQNSNFKLAVEIQRNRFAGILGWDGINLFIKNVPTSVIVKEGDRVITSDIGTLLPPQISVGVTMKPEKTVSGLLGNIFVKPFVDFSSVKNLFVVKVLQNPKLNDVKLNLLSGE